MSDIRRIWVTEVHNFGGFFGGDTVSLSATPWPDGDEETLTIDERALANVRERHLIGAEMLLELEQTGERVDRATLVGARERSTLSMALDVATAPLSAPQIRAFHCAACSLWLAGAPREQAGQQRCSLCDAPLS
jgi:hypothetical protein